VTRRADVLLTVPSDRPSRALQQKAQRARRARTAIPGRLRSAAVPRLHTLGVLPRDRAAYCFAESRVCSTSWVGGPRVVQCALCKRRAGAPALPRHGVCKRARGSASRRRCVPRKPRAARIAPQAPLAGGCGGGPFNITRHYAFASQLRALAHARNDARSSHNTGAMLKGPLGSPARKHRAPPPPGAPKESRLRLRRVVPFPPRRVAFARLQPLRVFRCALGAPRLPPSTAKDSR
jgi:hypothetical protein